jgi:hypothetical protein
MNEANVTFFIYFVSVIQCSNRRHFITSKAFYQTITILAIEVHERRSIIKRDQNNQEFRCIFCPNQALRTCFAGYRRLSPAMRAKRTARGKPLAVLLVRMFITHLTNKQSSTAFLLCYSAKSTLNTRNTGGIAALATGIL